MDLNQPSVFNPKMFNDERGQFLGLFNKLESINNKIGKVTRAVLQLKTELEAITNEKNDEEKDEEKEKVVEEIIQENEAEKEKDEETNAAEADVEEEDDEFEIYWNCPYPECHYRVKDKYKSKMNSHFNARMEKGELKPPRCRQRRQYDPPTSDGRWWKTYRLPRRTLVKLNIPEKDQMIEKQQNC